MTNEMHDNDTMTLLGAAFSAFTEQLPDWQTMPASALLMFIEMYVYDAREWAFKAHSPKDAQEWMGRVQQYQEQLPHAKELGIEENPQVGDELGKVMMLVLGGAAALCALSIDAVEEGQVDFDRLWTDDFGESEHYQQMHQWGGQSFTWIVLKLEQLVEEARPVVLAYEMRDCDGVDVSYRVMPILLLANAVMFMLMLEHLDDETREHLAHTLEGLDSPAPEDIH